MAKQQQEEAGPEILQFRVQKTGPVALYDPEGVQIAVGSQSDCWSEACDNARAMMEQGKHVQVVQLDVHGLMLRVVAFYPPTEPELVEFDDEQPELEEDPEPAESPDKK